MKTTSLVVVLLAASVSFAADKPASRPASADEVSRLRQQVEALTEQVRALRAEVARLTALSHNAAAPAVEDRDIQKAVREGRIIAGMTEAQVEAAMGQTITRDTHHDDERVIDGKPVLFHYRSIGSSRYGNFDLTFRDGVLIRVEH